MSQAKMATDGQLRMVNEFIYKIGYPRPKKYEKLDRHEELAVTKLQKAFRKNKTLTLKQYKCFKHLCDKEGFSLENSLVCIIGD